MRLSALVLAALAAFDAPAADDAQNILRSACISCHGAGRAMAGLRLDTMETAARAVVPGRSSDSALIRRVISADPRRRMPLGAAALKPEQIAVLRAWIDALPASSAKPEEPKHWAYRKPVRPALPEPNSAAAVRNPIDRFLLARLEKEGLAFSPEAPRQTLIRRVSLDLTGLPPSLAEVDAFVADTRPDAYERLVNRLLASPHFGERWARPWLDLARYADTNGYEKDRRRTMWKYRDWVIDAFNQDMPFDRFTIEQIAGDMLPDATPSEKIATGFHRNTQFNEEGGVDRDEAQFEVMVDRVNTTATVWLATTFTCAQCHNHKYDPFTQRDYYSLMAFFNNGRREIEQYGDTSTKYKEPELDLATATQETRRRRLRDSIHELEARLETPTPELEREQAAWEASVREADASWQAIQPERAVSAGGAKLDADASGALLASGANARHETFTVEGNLPVSKPRGIRIEALPHASLPRGGPGRDVYGNFVVTSVLVETALAGGGWAPVEMKRIVADDGRVDDKGRQLWTVDATRDDRRLRRQLILLPKSPLEPGQARLRITIVGDSDFSGQSMGSFRVSASGAADPALSVRLRAKMRPLFEIEAPRRTPDQGREFASYFRDIAPSLEPVRDRVKDLKSDLDRLGVVTALVMQERPGFERPFDFVRTRGGFANKAEKVYANVPAALHPLPEDALPNRLGLAKWLASTDNPLTPRVVMNRIWEQYFGCGIVETSEDFGMQGERPTHPELLDWLATEFIARGWSLKAMHRLIVTSAAYRQTSRVTPDVLRIDPYNRLISRGPRFRMEAEMIRDAALAGSALLSAKIGGPSVFPPQPPGVWDIPYSDDKWVESKGEDRFRRGLYTFVRRSALYPAMMNFDGTSREVCTVRRVRTNTPLQALTTLNDAAFFEIARALGDRIRREGGSNDRARIAYGFRLVTARTPRPAEFDRIQGWMEDQRRYFSGHSAEAAKLGAGPEEATWTMFGNVLLNLDETLTKE